MAWEDFVDDAEAGRPRLGVRRMVLALVLAAFLGGALGLVWHSSGLADGDDDGEAEVEEPEATPSPPTSG